MTITENIYFTPTGATATVDLTQSGGSKRVEQLRTGAAEPIDNIGIDTVPTVTGRISSLVPAGHGLVVVALGRRNREWVAAWLQELLSSASVQDVVGTPSMSVESTNRYPTGSPEDSRGIRRVFVVTAQDWKFSEKYRQEPIVSVTAAELLSGAENVPGWAMDRLIG